jgi:hypothetical protein
LNRPGSLNNLDPCAARLHAPISAGFLASFEAIAQIRKKLQKMS